VDAVVSGLVFNFIADQADALQETKRVCRPGGTVAAYVWDYAEGMQFLRLFWDAARAIDPAAAELDEGTRFPVCREGALAELWAGQGLQQVSSRAIDVRTVFANFDDLWQPFLGGQGPAPSYVAALHPQAQDELAGLIKSRITPASDGTLPLQARAWAVRGTW
jgi:SAM-dependent methyltransferase